MALYDRIPPHNTEAEQSILGSMLIDKEILPEVISRLKTDDFYMEQHRSIFECMVDLYNGNNPVDLITVSDSLNQKGLLEKVGNYEYLSNLAICVPTTANYKSYIKIVEEKSIRRKVIQKSAEVTNKAYEDEYENIVDFKNDVLENFSDIILVEDRNKKTLKAISRSFDDDLKYKLNRKNEDENKFYTGIADYDFWLDGLHKKELTIIGARPSVGKTALGLYITKNLSKKGVNCVFNSLEMSNEQVFSRLIASEGMINSHKLRKPKLMTKEELKTYEEIRKYIESLSLIIDESTKYIQDIRSLCRKLKLQNKLDVLFVDYLQLVQTMKNCQNRVGEIGDISRTFKSISKEFDIPVVVLAQLSRSNEKENREPRLSDLRESGDIEQDADNVIFLHKPNDVDDLSEIQDRKIIIAKQRNGATGYFMLQFEGKTFNFRNVEKKVPEMLR